jgi:Dolichyl-phosphate-mannose-protein mannosyltransferase
MDPRPEMQGRLGAWVFEHWAVIVGLSWLLSGALYLTVPPSPDQFNHAYMGWRLLEGDIPYRDFIDVNWPGVMGLHALAVWIFGVNLWSWHALDFLLFAASALFLADLVRLAAGREAGKLGLILFPVVYLSAWSWMSGQHDMSAAQFLVGALWFHVRGYQRRSWWWQLGTGLFIGAAMLNKPTVGVSGLLLPMQALWLRNSMVSVLKHTAAAGAAAVATLLVALGAVLARGTSLREIVEAVFTYNIATQYVDGNKLTDLIVQIVVYHFRHWSMYTLAAVPAVVWMLRRVNLSMAGTALPVLWLAGILSYFIQWRDLGYHLAPCLIALAGAAAVSLALVTTGRITLGGIAWQRTIGAGFVALVLVGIGYKLAVYRSLPMALLSGDYGRYLARFPASDNLTVADAVSFVRRLDALPTTDCVFVVGESSAINYLSRRRQPTRFYYFPVLDRMRSSLPLFQRWVELWEQDLQVADCRYVLVARWVLSRFHGPSRVAVALREYLKRYRESGVLGANGEMLIYERR